ncbi:hypothetical protein OIB37_01265 [Streptomyces sp. NBC_00820]|uniref:hypothetical protein n=1 Tax=Streptomyces sp. NBC_00820 TaxID=2975842 RepID=UPI002ED4C850|nr:hypothetical protein OIB37_01265 [Streptomyces sp. NBC_00820]
MSNPVAYPVFRTTDPVLALRVARQLAAVGERHASWLAEQIGQSVIGPPQE